MMWPGKARPEFLHVTSTHVFLYSCLAASKGDGVGVEKLLTTRGFVVIII